MVLSIESFNILKKKIGDKDFSIWYDRSYQIVRNRDLDPRIEEDFMLLVAIAYSWMPTIPELHDELNWDDCSTFMQNLHEDNRKNLDQMLELLVPYVNNSIVGVSKALHFAYPETIHIIDSNVIKGWRALFYPDGIRGKKKKGVVALPSNFGGYGKDTDKRSRHISLYVDYCENIDAWSTTIGEKPRDIEKMLYLYGRDLS